MTLILEVDTLRVDAPNCLYFSALSARQKQEWIDILTTKDIILKSGHEIDNGYVVPKVLATLRKLLYKSNGIEVEGIFRVSGIEAKMNRISEAIAKNQSIKVDPNDGHSIAALIKVYLNPSSLI